MPIHRRVAFIGLPIAFVAVVLLVRCHPTQQTSVDAGQPAPVLDALLNADGTATDLGSQRALHADLRVDAVEGPQVVWSTHIVPQYSYYQTPLGSFSGGVPSPRQSRETERENPRESLGTWKTSTGDVQFPVWAGWGVLEGSSFPEPQGVAFENADGGVVPLTHCNQAARDLSVGGSEEHNVAWAGLGSVTCSPSPCPEGGIPLYRLTPELAEAPPPLCILREQANAHTSNLALHPSLEVGIYNTGGMHHLFRFNKNGVQVLNSGSSRAIPVVEAFYPDEPRLVMRALAIGPDLPETGLFDVSAASDGGLETVPSIWNPWLETVEVLVQTKQGLLAVGRQRRDTVPEDAPVNPYLAILQTQDGFKPVTLNPGANLTDLRVLEENDVLGLFWFERQIDEDGVTYHRLWGKRLLFH